MCCFSNSYLFSTGERRPQFSTLPTVENAERQSDSFCARIAQRIFGASPATNPTRVRGEQAPKMDNGKEINQNALEKLQATIRDAAQAYHSLPEKTKETQEDAIFNTYCLFVEVNQDRINKLKKLEGLLPNPPEKYFSLESSILDGTFLDVNQK